MYVAILETLIEAGAQLPGRHVPVNKRVDEWLERHGNHAERTGSGMAKSRGLRSAPGEFWRCDRHHRKFALKLVEGAKAPGREMSNGSSWEC